MGRTRRREGTGPQHGFIRFTPRARTLEGSAASPSIPTRATAARRSQLLLTAGDQTRELTHETLKPLDMQTLPVPQAHGHDLLNRVEACGLKPR